METLIQCVKSNNISHFILSFLQVVKKHLKKQMKLFAWKENRETVKQKGRKQRLQSSKNMKLGIF